MKVKLICIFLFTSLIGCLQKPDVPTLFLVGDSTMRNGQGDGSNGEWGWGDYLYQFFDTTRIHISNEALGGRSSRTYMSEGLWQAVKEKIKPGDFVIIEFGHNDDGNINDNHRARGTIKANNEDSVEIDNILTGKHEVVYSFGWYIRKYIREARALGATPMVCSLTPRNVWQGDTVVIRATDNYTQWTKEAAASEGAYFIDHNDLIATRYEALGKEYVTEKFFLTDHTHTNRAGAILNAEEIADGIRKLNIEPLVHYLKN